MGYPVQMEDDRDGIYSIGAVVKMLGVPAQTLRSWEDRYHQIVPRTKRRRAASLHP